MDKQYFRVMAGKGSIYVDECFAKGFIGVDFGFTIDFTEHLPDNWREFNKEFIPLFLQNHPDKSKVAAGLACGMTHTVAKSLQVGDVVLCPTGLGGYRAGKISGPYQYCPGEILPHRRPVQWLEREIQKGELSEDLRRSAGAIGPICNLSDYGDEIEKLIGTQHVPVLTVDGSPVQDPGKFQMEKHLEEFIVQNWAKTIFGKEYKIFADEDGSSGQQYDIGDGRIDILAISNDQKTLLVIELKKGRASDVVVGQTLRYMGYVKEVLADIGQQVLGAIIALEDDRKLRQALKMVPFIEFYRYKIHFDLVKA